MDIQWLVKKHPIFENNRLQILEVGSKKSKSINLRPLSIESFWHFKTRSLYDTRFDYTIFSQLEISNFLDNEALHVKMLQYFSIAPRQYPTRK